MSSDFPDVGASGAGPQGEKAWLSAILTVTFFLASYITATLLHEVIGRRGLPSMPFLYLVVLIPVSVIVVQFEDGLRAREDWPRLKKVWNGGFFLLAGVAPIALTLWKPLAFATGLPRGGATLVALVSEAVIIVVLVAGASRVLRRS